MLSSLTRTVSPPPLSSTSRADQRERKRRKLSTPDDNVNNTASGNCEKVATDKENPPSLAAIEAGKATIADHLDVFSRRLTEVIRPIFKPDEPRLDIAEWRDLFMRNEGGSGKHFVVHQHDHPVSGTHYDLRLQVSASSTISFAIPYGLPGYPNSKRLQRLAIETRVHPLWNNLVETASHVTGSMIIWDVGEYEVLPRKGRYRAVEVETTDDELEEHQSRIRAEGMTEQEKLVHAFQSRSIKLRLNGTRLPRGYTIDLRLPRKHDVARKPSAKIRRKENVKTNEKVVVTSSSGSDGESDDDEAEEDEAAVASESDDPNNDRETIRRNNAYPGATNDVGSIHQRHWILRMDRLSSGFIVNRRQRIWVPGRDLATGAVTGFESFFVMGRDVERSVLTGRRAEDVLNDEGVERFQIRKMWQPITQ